MAGNVSLAFSLKSCYLPSQTEFAFSLLFMVVLQNQYSWLVVYSIVMPGLTRLYKRQKSCPAGDSPYVSCIAWRCLVLPCQR